MIKLSLFHNLLQTKEYELFSVSSSMEDIKMTFCHKRKNSAKIWNVSLGAFRHLHNGIRIVYISYLVKMKHLHRLNELHPILKWRWIGWDKMLVKVNDVKLNTEIDNICCYIQSTCIWNVCIGVLFDIQCKLRNLL